MRQLSQRSYSLCLSERYYNEDVLLSYYYKPNFDRRKKCKPIDLDGCRYRLNLDTGAIENYTKKDLFIIGSASIRRSRILMRELFMLNDFDWFGTLTFDNYVLDRRNDFLVYSAYKKWIKNFSRRCPNLIYMTFPERHDDGCIHFHILIGGVSVQDLKLTYSGTVLCHWAYKKNGICSEKYFNKTKDEHILEDTDGLKVYNIGTFHFGYTTITCIASKERCCSYVMKYVDKAVKSPIAIFKKRFFYSNNLIRPKKEKFVLSDNCDRMYGLDWLDDVVDHPYYLMSDRRHLTKYNVMQCWVNKKDIELVQSGIVPLTDKECREYDVKNIFEMGG